MKPFRTLVLCVCLIFACTSTASAATLGPVSDYTELLALSMQAEAGDIILVSGELSASGLDPLSTQAMLRITSSGDRAAIRELALHDAQIIFSDIDLLDTLTITGTSHVELGSGVTVEGAEGSSGISFTGNGELIIDADCNIVGGSGGDGISIRHTGGEFYGGIDGHIRGGSGQTGGTGLNISTLKDSGTMMIAGRIYGGNGAVMGGNALNLYDLSGNAYVTIAGTLRGGEGTAGGDGAQIVSAQDNVSIGIDGQIAGGLGENYGGDALMLMSIDGASSINLSGALIGGDALRVDAQPGVSLLIVGETTTAHTRVGDCMLQDGQRLTTPAPATPPEAQEAPQEPDVTPLPEITSSVEDTGTLPTPTASPTPTPTPTLAPTVSPESTTSPEPTASPTVEPTLSPTVEPTLSPTLEPTASPTSEPEATPDGNATPPEASAQ